VPVDAFGEGEEVADELALEEVAALGFVA